MSNTWGNATLQVDGYEIGLQVQQDKMRLVIAVFVNGWMKGEWLINKTEEAKRFCRPCTVALWTPSAKKQLTAGLRKSAIKRYFPDLDKRSIYYLSHWLSFGALKRHLIKNNKSIELVEPKQVQPVLQSAAE